MGAVRDDSDDVFRSGGTLRTDRFGYVPQSHTGSHVRLRYQHPKTDEVRLVDVPLHDEIAIGTLYSIADQCGAEDFQDWWRWIDRHS